MATIIDGKKIAAEVHEELKSKIDVADMGPDLHRSLNRDALEALLHLGYDKNLVTRVLSEAPSNVTETEELIRFFLKSA